MRVASGGDILDEFGAVLALTHDVDQQGLHPLELASLVDAQIAAMTDYVIAHGHGDVAALAHAERVPAKALEHSELDTLGYAGLDLMSYLPFDSGSRELGRVAVGVLASQLGADGDYRTTSEDVQLVGSDLGLEVRDAVGYLWIPNLSEDMDARIAAVLGQWAGGPNVPRALVLDFSSCETGSPATAGAVVNMFAPGRDAFTLDTRASDGAVAVERKIWRGAGGFRFEAYARTQLFVVTSARTGSLAEAVAQALRATREAQVLGAMTAGDGRVMRWVRLPWQAAFGFTVAMLIGVDGKPLRGQPLIPDACAGDGGMQRLPQASVEHYRALCSQADRGLHKDVAIDYVRSLLAAAASVAPPAHAPSEQRQPTT